MSEVAVSKRQQARRLDVESVAEIQELTLSLRRKVAAAKSFTDAERARLNALLDSAVTCFAKSIEVDEESRRLVEQAQKNLQEAKKLVSEIAGVPLE